MPRQTPGILDIASVWQLSVYPCSWLNLQKIGICFGLFSPTWSFFFTNMKYYFLIFPWIKKPYPVYIFQRVQWRAQYTHTRFFFLGQYYADSAVNPLMSPILCPSLFSKMPSILQLLHRNAITCTKTEGDAAITNTPRNHSKVWQLSPVLGRSSKDRDFFVHSRNFIFFKLYYG